ncbi:hypothetical protein [Streptomyces halstedii]|uniref:hypothetical protein n=1 Tax=Streptomyces halstedii TaxID=1944 RepID=UPI0033BF90D0
MTFLGLPTREPWASSLAAASCLAFSKELSMAFSGSPTSPQVPWRISIFVVSGFVARSPLRYWAPTVCGSLIPAASALAFLSPFSADDGSASEGSCLYSSTDAAGVSLYPLVESATSLLPPPPAVRKYTPPATTARATTPTPMSRPVFFFGASGCGGTPPYPAWPPYGGAGGCWP